MEAPNFGRGFEFIEMMNFEEEDEPENEPQPDREVRLAHSGIFSRGAQFSNDQMVRATISGLVHHRNLVKVLK